MYAWAPVDVPEVPPSDGVPERLTLHDTATGELVEVGPASGTARMYVCGITPYDATHLGHANTYLAFDLVTRVWRDLGLEVHYTQNVTDVDDPLLERADDMGQDWEDLAGDQTELFRSDMEDLRIIPPTDFVGVVESIPTVVDVVERLQQTGLIYQVPGEFPDWYFRSVDAPGFGHVSGLERDAMLPVFAERGGDPERPGKHDALDALLWRMARPGEPSWESALGAGRPGWHIECTAIALKHLGETFDVQAGGSDLVFPHHDMCNAQMMALTGKPLARAFVHSGMVGLDGQKMSKSLGNLELVSRLRHGGADPMAIRLALLDHHYRSDWEWTPDQLARAEHRLSSWRSMLNNPSALPAGGLVAEIRRCLRQDLDAPAALAAIDAWVAGSLVVDSDDDTVQDVATALDALLGIKL